jgi:hypothetical protein
MVNSNAKRNTAGKQELNVAQLIPPSFLFQGLVEHPLLFDGVYDVYVERAPIKVHVTSNREECGDHCEGKVKVRTTVR